MKQVVLLTGHYWDSRRKAGFHWLADAFLQADWDVTFFTTSFSWPSIVRGDYRLQYPVREEANRLLKKGERLQSFVWYTWYHPCNFGSRVANWLATPLFRGYGNLNLGEIEPKLKTADLFIFENGGALMLFDRIKALNPNARCVYRVSDDMRLLKAHFVLLETEKRIAPRFDLVSVPSQYIFNILQPLPNLRLQHHGVNKAAFDAAAASPFKDADAINAVFTGNARLDRAALAAAAELQPNWQFHIIGGFENIPQARNIHTYGELPFAQTVPYIKHARLGLQFLEYAPGAESFTDSLKVMQYTWCRLPIVAPHFLSSPRKHVFYYTPGNATELRVALHAAVEYDRATIDTSEVHSWRELAEEFAGVPAGV